MFRVIFLFGLIAVLMLMWNGIAEEYSYDRKPRISPLAPVPKPPIFKHYNPRKRQPYITL